MADIACLGSENAPNSFPKRAEMDPPIPPGYDFDDLPAEALQQASVRDGRLVLDKWDELSHPGSAPGANDAARGVGKDQGFGGSRFDRGGAAAHQFAQPG